jgi:hypothetical protein
MKPHLAALASSFLFAALAAAAPATAQTVVTTQPAIPEPPAAPSSNPAAPADEIIRVPDRPGQRIRAEAPAPGEMRMRPGGQLLVTFDTNHDGLISRSELEAGAASAFTAADSNQDGLVGGIEQTAWAAGYGGVHSVLSNAILFDANLDRSVNEQEFLAGVYRLAEPMRDSSGGVPVSSLMAAVTDEPQPQGGGFGTLTPRASDSRAPDRSGGFRMTTDGFGMRTDGFRYRFR